MARRNIDEFRVLQEALMVDIAETLPIKGLRLEQIYPGKL